MPRYPKKQIKELEWNTKMFINSNQGKRRGIKFHKTDGTTKQQITKLRFRFNYHQSILKEIISENSLEGLMCKLKLQYFGHLMWRADSCEKTLLLGNTEGRRRRGRQRTKWMDGTTDSMDKLWETVTDWGAWRAAVHGVAKCRTRLSNWTTMGYFSNGFE